MARTHSYYTTSPTRSPRRSPARRPTSEDGSQYEMDLDALGLNSTFESTDLDGNLEPVDCVETSDIEGPEDFTMNMTYWMTADLPLSQIKSRKEAKGKRQETRMDARQTDTEEQTSVGGGDDAMVEEGSSGRKDGGSHSIAPTMRANGTPDKRVYSTPASERSMQHDEKVRSFLSALPDTEMDSALMGTPPHVPKQSFLQVPRSSPPKARSLQPTVEDCDTTPRKPTQETVIHHRYVSSAIDTSGNTAMQKRIAELESRLETHELAAKTRITELETILSYTRTELEGARVDNYKHKERFSSLGKDMEQQKAEHETARSLSEAQRKSREQALQETVKAKMQDYGEELRQQNLSKLQSQRADFEQQLRALEESKRAIDEQMSAKARTLEQVQAELTQLRQSNKHEAEDDGHSESKKHQSIVEAAEREREKLSTQLSSVQTRADGLQAELQKATVDARAAREEAQNWNAMHTAMDAKHRAQKSHNSDLEKQLQSALFELECAQADVAAKQQLFQTNLDLNARLRDLKAELEASHAGNTTKSLQLNDNAKLESRIDSLQSQLESCRTDLASKEQQLSHRTESQEQSEQHLDTAQGRIQGLETAIAALRQQLAESRRDSAKARTEIERLEGDLEDANDGLQDARAEADRRVADVEKKLNAMKERKIEAENKLKELQSQHHDLIERHEVVMEDVRDNAEDAVRKAGALLDQERNEKKRIVKDLHRAKADMAKLQAETAQRAAEEPSDDESSTALSVPDSTRDTELANLREIIRRQVAETKTLKSEAAALRKENKTLKAAETSSQTKDDLQSTIASLQSQLLASQTEAAALQSRLDTQAEDFAAINTAMDERLATALSKLMKERAKSVVGKRDGQWVESVGKIQSEKELMGKVLMRQWGREETGIADEKSGERQGYLYKYAKRS